MRRESLLPFVFGGILLLIIMMILGIIAFVKTPTPKKITPPTVVPITTPNTNPPVQWNPDASNKLLQTLNMRPTLTPSDTTLRDKIIANVSASGTVYETSNVRIDYVQSANVFQGEILTVDIAQGKKDAEDWFKGQGLSPQGICNLPLEFYLNFDVANRLRGTNVVFNPLPDGC